MLKTDSQSLRKQSKQKLTRCRAMHNKPRPSNFMSSRDLSIIHLLVLLNTTSVLCSIFCPSDLNLGPIWPKIKLRHDQSTSAVLVWNSTTIAAMVFLQCHVYYSWYIVGLGSLAHLLGWTSLALLFAQAATCNCCICIFLLTRQDWTLTLCNHVCSGAQCLILRGMHIKLRS